MVMDTKKTICSETWIDPDEISPLVAEFLERATGLAKGPVSLRLAPDLVSKLRAPGPGWQGKAAEASIRRLGNARRFHLTRWGVSGTG